MFGFYIYTLWQFLSMQSLFCVLESLLKLWPQAAHSKPQSGLYICCYLKSSQQQWDQAGLKKVEDGFLSSDFQQQYKVLF